MNLSNTQKLWLSRLTNHPKRRLRYGAPGMPERTANVLIRAGLARREWQPIFLSARGTGHVPHTFFVVPVEQPKREGESDGLAKDAVQ